MNDRLQGLRVPAVVAVVLVVAGQRGAQEVFERVIAPSSAFVDHLTLTFALFGATLVVVGALAALLCRVLGVRRRVLAPVALGAGLAIAAQVMSAGLSSAVNGLVIGAELEGLYPNLDLVQPIAITLLVFVGLRLAQSPPAWAAVAGLGAGALVYAVYGIDPTRFGFEHYDLVHDVQRYGVMLGLPVLCAVAAFALAEREL